MLLMTTKFSITYPNLPLAIYREVAAHLRQVRGVVAEVLPQTSAEFNYNQSQSGGLLLEYSPDIDSQERAQAEAILSHYATIYGTGDRQFI